MDDREFLSLFHKGILPGEEFRHRGHIRLAWLILAYHTRDEAATIVALEIQRFASANGAPGRYHDTLTRFWARLSRCWELYDSLSGSPRLSFGGPCGSLDVANLN